ncbi:VOC family protein [Flavobacterium ponti]|uniref:VOC family protein n=1 Tax=Flavobacterium ponti TaxID=665133 RepID=A0ABV9P6Y5_9FLAO
MEPQNPVYWFEIYVEDMNRAQKFYETVLDVNLTSLPTPETIEDSLSMMAFPSNQNGPGSSGALVYMKGFKAGGNSTIIYFGAEDCAIEESRIEAAGGKIFKNKFSIGEYGFISLAYDTEGNMFGLYSMA